MWCAAADVGFLLPSLDLSLGSSTLTLVEGVITQQTSYLSAKYPGVDPLYNPVLVTLCALKSAAIVIASITSTGNVIGETNLSDFYSRQANVIESGLDSGAIVLATESGIVYPSGFTIVEYDT